MPPRLQLRRRVHLQSGYRSPADRRSADDRAISSNLKMFRPSLLPRMEQRYHFRSLGINSLYRRALSKIASATRQRHIDFRIRAPARCRHYVIHLERKVEHHLRCATVFTTVLGARRNLPIPRFHGCRLFAAAAARRPAARTSASTSASNSACWSVGRGLPESRAIRHAVISSPSRACSATPKNSSGAKFCTTTMTPGASTFCVNASSAAPAVRPSDCAPFETARNFVSGAPGFSGIIVTVVISRYSTIENTRPSIRLTLPL